MGKSATSVADAPPDIASTMEPLAGVRGAQRPLFNRDFAIAFLAHLTFVYANMLLTHYARWVEFIGGSVRDVGWVLGVGGCVALILRPFAGPYIDRLGAHRIWFVGLLMFGFTLFASISITSLGPYVYLLRVLMLVGQGLIFTASLTYISQSAPAHRQTEAIAIFGAAGFIGMCTAPYLGDVLLGTGDRGKEDFDRLFVTAAVLLCVGIALLTCLRSFRKGTATTRLGLRGFVQTVRRHWPGSVLAASLVYCMVLQVPFAFLASYVDAEGIRGSSVSGVGIFFLAYGGLGLIVRLFTCRVPDRFGRRRVLVVGLMLVSLGMFSFFLVDSARLWTVLIPGLICGSGHALLFPTTTSLTLASFPPESRGVGATLSLMVFDSGVMLAAPLFGFVADSFGFATLFGLAGTMALAVTVYFGLVNRDMWSSRSGEAGGPLSPAPELR